MYRVNVLTSGKYNNATIGPRYCFTRKTAKQLAKFFVDRDCDVTVHKFIRVTNHFIWSDYRDVVGFVINVDTNDLIKDDN